MHLTKRKRNKLRNYAAHLPELYVRNGAVFITDVQYLLTSDLVISDEPVIYVMPAERSMNIDTRYDMELTEWLMERASNGK